MKIEPGGTWWPVDGDGFLVRRPYAPAPPWTEAIRECVAFYRRHPHLRAVYVRGSAADGTARAGVSDLDTFAVLGVPATPADFEAARRGAADLQGRFPFCAAVELTYIHEIDDWRRFQIKVLGTCVEGGDLAPGLKPFRPEEAVFAEGQLVRVMRIVRERMASGSTAALCRWLARAVVRAGFDRARTGRYTRDLWLCWRAFADAFPAEGPWMFEALKLGIEPSSDRGVLTRLLEIPWLARVRLRSQPYAGDWPRIVPAEETVARLERFAAPGGPVRSLRRDADPDFPVYHAHVLDGIAVGGKGTTDARARASVLAEALERLSSLLPGDGAGVRGMSIRQAGERAVPLAECLLVSDRQYADRERWNAHRVPFCHVPERIDPDTPLDWRQAWSLTHGIERLVPLPLLHGGRVPGRSMIPWDSNGTASGNCLEEAVLHALLELVERDATAVWWYNRLQRPAAAADAPWIAEVRERLGRRRRRMWLLDLTGDLGIPACGAFSAAAEPPAVVFGFGAHLTPALAAIRAVSEMVQFLVAEKAILGEAAPPPKTAMMQRWLREADVDREPWLMPSGDGPARTPLATGDLLEDIGVVRRRLESKGLEVIVADLTRPGFGLPTVRAIVPGLRPIRRRLAPGRLYQVPGAAREEDMNPWEFVL